MLLKLLTPKDTLAAGDMYNQINFLYTKIKDLKLKDAKSGITQDEGQTKIFKLQLETSKQEIEKL